MYSDLILKAPQGSAFMPWRCAARRIKFACCFYITCIIPKNMALRNEKIYYGAESFAGRLVKPTVL